MRWSKVAWLGLLLLSGAGGAPWAACAQVDPQPPVQDFVPPPPGTYRLPPIQDAANGWVLEGNYVPRRLSQYTHGALTLLTFIYTYCTDPIGCPLAYATLDSIKTGVVRDPRLKGKVRLVSLSFDPSNDTPQAMKIYGGSHAREPAVPWHFLTTYSMSMLKPILDGYGQDVEVVTGADGKPSRAITHLLKMFLLDRDAKVREIYSAAFLHPEVILNDLRTLAMETAP